MFRLELHLKDADKCDSYIAILRKMSTNFSFRQIFCQVLHNSSWTWVHEMKCFQIKRPGFTEVLRFACTMKSPSFLYNVRFLKSRQLEPARECAKVRDGQRNSLLGRESSKRSSKLEIAPNWSEWWREGGNWHYTIIFPYWLLNFYWNALKWVLAIQFPRIFEVSNFENSSR